MTSTQTEEQSSVGGEQWFLILDTVVLSIAILFGIFGNLLTVVTVSLSKQIRTVPNVYVSSLSVANLALSGIVTPYFVGTLWSKEDGKGTVEGCAPMAYVTLVLLTITLYNHAAISINRYIMVTKSKKIYMNRYKSWKVCVSLILIWLIPSFLFTVPFFGFGTYGYDSHREMCMFKQENYHQKVSLIYLFLS